MNSKNDLIRIGGAVLGAVAIAAGGLFVPVAIADATTAETAADELPPFAVEDFNYPGADRILAERGFLLKRGDGHIVLADCGSEGDLMEFSVRSLGLVCFRVTGDEGYLALEMPSVFGIRTGDSTTTYLEMTVDNEERTYEIPANTPAAIGESADPEGRPHTLVEIRTTS